MRINKNRKQQIYKRNVPKRKIKLNGLCVCVDFGDYLDYTMQYNRSIFDTVTIVTTDKDYETKRVCHKYNLNVVVTKRLYEDDAPFNKGKAINDGYLEMDKEDWICIFDADIIFPFFHNILHKLDQTMLYSIPRKDINITKHISNITQSSHENELRLCSDECLIGYCQLFHSTSINTKHLYHEKFPTARRSDTKFSKRFAIDKNIYIANLLCYHISQRNINWSGRVSKRLGEIS